MRALPQTEAIIQDVPWATSCDIWTIRQVGKGNRLGKKEGADIIEHLLCTRHTSVLMAFSNRPMTLIQSPRNV